MDIGNVAVDVFQSCDHVTQQAILQLLHHQGDLVNVKLHSIHELVNLPLDSELPQYILAKVRWVS
jgi:hypothetical protein